MFIALKHYTDGKDSERTTIVNTDIIDKFWLNRDDKGYSQGDGFVIVTDPVEQVPRTYTISEETYDFLCGVLGVVFPPLKRIPLGFGQ